MVSSAAQARNRTLQLMYRCPDQAILTKTIDLITLKDTEDMTFEDKIALLKEDLPKRTRELSDSSAACIQASKDTTAEFQRCLDLATEINISVVATRGDEELKAKRNELERARLEAKLAAAAEDKERVKKELETSKEMLNRVIIACNQKQGCDKLTMMSSSQRNGCRKHPAIL